jgi:hypothetical protein
MTASGARPENFKGAGPPRNNAGRTNPGAEPPPGAAPYRLLWATGVIAFLLCVAAFVFWGINGAATLLDLVAALCT